MRRTDGFVSLRFAILPSHPSRVLGLPRNSEARSYEVLRVSGKIILANLKIWCSKMQQFSGNQRPPDMSDGDVSCTVPATQNAKCIFADSLQMSHTCHCFWNCCKTFTFGSLFQGAESIARATKSDVWTSKSGPNVVCFPTYFRVNLVHFLNNTTSKSSPALRCFFETRLAPQRHTLFEQPNFRKYYETEVFWTVWLRNVLRATGARTFWATQLPKVLRCWRVFDISTSKCASRYSRTCTFSAVQLAKTFRNWSVFNIFSILTWKMCFVPQLRAVFCFHPAR